MKRLFAVLCCVVLAAALLGGCKKAVSSSSAFAGTDSGSSASAEATPWPPKPLTTAAPSPAASSSSSSSAPVSSSAPAASAAPARLSGDWNGSFYRDPGSASQITLTITNFSEKGFSFTFSVKGEEFSGQATPDGLDKASYTLNNYTVTFSFSGKSVQVNESAAYSSHLSFTGSYGPDNAK